MNKNVPKLRFKEFSEDWKFYKADELFINISDKKHNGELDVLSVTQDRGVLLRKDLEIDIKFDPESVKNYKKVKSGDFIISLRSFQGGFEISNQEGLISPAYTVFNFKEKSKFSSRYFSYIFKSSLFIKKLAGLIYGVRDGKAISFTDFKTMKFCIPPLQEQEKIADFFTILDSLIEEQDGEVSDLELYKKGMMQKIFSQEIRFKDENGSDYLDWEESTLGKQGHVITGNTPSTKNYEYYNGEYLWASPVDLGSVKYIKSTKSTLTSLGFSKVRKIKKNSILVTCIGSTIGKIGIAKYDMGTNQQINSFYSDNNINEFIYYYLQYNFKKYLSYIATQAVPIINKSQFELLELNIPCLEEQQHIVDILSNIDNLIEEEKKNLEDLREMKKGLLQQMFV